MTAAPIAFASEPGRYQFLGTTQLVNAYAEKQGTNAKGPLAVLPCDGLVEFTDTESGTQCRGMIYLEDLEELYTVHSTSVYKIISDGTVTRIGTVPGSDPVQLSRNQHDPAQIVVRSNLALQIIEANSVYDVIDADLDSPVVSQDHIGGYTVYLMEDRRFFISGINSSADVDTLDFATFEQRAGKGIRVFEDAGQLIGFCSSWMEFWRDTGNSDFPFEPMGFKSRGCRAPHAVVRCDQTVMFPGDDGNFYRLDNYNPVLISSGEVSRLIQEDTNSADLIGFSWNRAGHAFANVTGSDWSRCYDAATGEWHARQSYGQNTWRGRFSAAAFGKTVVGDKLSGKLFYLDANTYTEDGGTMLWKVVSPPLHVFPNGAILDAVHFDLATGFGTLTGQGADPKIMLRTSTDGGNTFGNYRELELGSTGNYQSRVTARRLGRFGPKGIVFELSISDPVARSLVNCDVQLRPLRR